MNLADAPTWQPELQNALQAQTARAQDALQTLAEIAAECAHCHDSQPDAMRAALLRVHARASGQLQPALPQALALPPWGVFEAADEPAESVAMRNAALHDMMADTVDPEPAGLAVARAAPDDAAAPPATPTDAEWRRDSLQMQRELIDQALAAEVAAAHWRKLSSAEANERAEAAQRAADARHQAQLQAMGQVRLSPRDIASGVLNGLPPEVDAATEAAIVERRVRLALSYPDDASQPLPAPPADAPPPQHPPPPVQTPVPPPAPMPVPAPAPQLWALPMLTTEAEFAQLRGFGGFFAGQGWPGDDYLPTLRATGATHARCWYSATWDGQRYVVDQAQRGVMHRGIRQADALGLYVVLCVQIAEGGMPWGDSAKLDAYVQLMADLAAEHVGQTPVAGVDMTNEPALQPLDRPATAEDYARLVREWRELAHRIVDTWRAVDPGRLMVYQMGIGGDPSQFEEGLPLDRPGVIHSAHVYHPHPYTHQNVSDLVAGRPPGQPWRRMTASESGVLHASLTTLARWSDRHGGRVVYIGETAAIRFAPDAPEYLRRVLDFSNSRGWPWSKHDWRGWFGWDSEMQGAHSDIPLRSGNTPEMQVLRAALQAGKTSRQ